MRRRTKDTVRVAAIGDLHVGRMSAASGSRVLPPLPSDADVLVLCGDLTDRGTEEETRLLAKELAVVGVPVVAVLGNHDVESGQEARVSQILDRGGGPRARRRERRGPRHRVRRRAGDSAADSAAAPSAPGASAR